MRDWPWMSWSAQGTRMLASRIRAGGCDEGGKVAEVGDFLHEGLRGGGVEGEVGRGVPWCAEGRDCVNFEAVESEFWWVGWGCG